MNVIRAKQQGGAGRRKQIAAALLGGAAGWLGFAASATAGPGQTTWTTYLYQGPSYRYSVVDEVPQAQPLDVISCANGWCKVSFEQRTGYVLAEVVVQNGQSPLDPPKGILAQPANQVVPHPKGPCFPANIKGGNGGNDLSYFCQK